MTNHPRRLRLSGRDPQVHRQAVCPQDHQRVMAGAECPLSCGFRMPVTRRLS